jgi:AcrR family transcriptional regulator
MTATEPLSLRERKKLRTRQALAETAVAMFAERGFEATTLDALVDAVEVSKRTFFRNFRSKDDVALTAVKQFWDTCLGTRADRPAAGGAAGRGARDGRADGRLLVPPVPADSAADQVLPVLGRLHPALLLRDPE